MGHIISKLIKSDSKSSNPTHRKKTEDMSTQTVEIEDVRSPSSNIIRTPIIVEKLKPELEFRDYSSLPLRTKLLKTLKLDPRSPTVGIYRTPIIVEDSASDKASKDNFDSPVSIYSCDISSSIAQDIMTPIEPSVNVSDFEAFRGLDDFDITLEPEGVTKSNTLKLGEKPTTCEGRRLLDEILLSEEENLKKVKSDSKKENKSELKSDKKVLNDTKGRSRPPLSNITLSTNSPNHVITGRKIFSRNKVLTDYGSENSSSPKVKHLGHWDQNNTVII